mgnify:CR=1 FL=1
MPTEQPILHERRGKHDGIVWVTLNRPEKLNALTFPLLEELLRICIDARADRSVRCFVITGAGRGFCAGMDHGGGANPTQEGPSETLEAHQEPNVPRIDIEGERLNFRTETEAFIALRRLDVPVIVAINGACVGAGFDLACHADLAVGSTTARYQVAYIKRGLYADLGGFWSIPKIIGWRKAMEMMMTGRFMSAEEAHNAGLTNYLVEPEELEAKTMELALSVEAGPPIGQKVGKMLAYKTSGMDFESALQWSEMALPLVTLSEDRLEGVRSFIEKREPNFEGR